MSQRNTIFLKCRKIVECNQDAKFHLVYIHTPEEFKFTKEGLAQISNFIWNFILKNFLRKFTIP